MSTRNVEWIELVTGFSCNCRCRVCPSAYLDDPSSMSLDEMSGALREGRRLGATGVWFGGGEPTIHPELPRAVAAARRLGFSAVRLQTNGLRLAYPDYAAKLVDLGIDRFAFSVMGHEAGRHDAMTRLPGSFELMTRAVGNLARRDVRLEADVLIHGDSVEYLAETVRRFSGLGIGTFTFWLTSLHGLPEEAHADRVPPLSRITPALQSAFDAADALDVEATELHLPPCTLDESYRARYFHAGRWNLLVVVPGGEPFTAEQSPMEGGTYLDSCDRCAARGDCLGAREDFLRLHGTAGFEPLAP